MKEFLIAIRNKLQAVPGMKYVALWNNQFDLDEDQKHYTFDFPCAFIEVINDQPVKQLGDGVQLYDPLVVRIHIGHHELDAGDGTLEQNLNVMDLMQEVFAALDGFEPDMAVAFCRTSETRDYTHTNVYHGIQDYITNLIDDSKQVSTDGTEVEGGTIELETDVTYDPPPFLKKL